jgi:hypothetical protein
MNPSLKALDVLESSLLGCRRVVLWFKGILKSGEFIFETSVCSDERTFPTDAIPKDF